jgi:phosphoserine phosphatase RsbU/P
MSAAKILAVDDAADFELLITQRFRRQIRDKEFEFRFAHHGEEALAALVAEPDIDLMLLDINMPVMDGLTRVQRGRDPGRDRLRAPLDRIHAGGRSVTTGGEQKRGKYGGIRGRR